MLNGDLKDIALKALREEESKREVCGKKVILASEKLYKKRQEISVTIIPIVENYINSIVNTPKEFDAAVKKLEMSYKEFKEEIRIAEKAYNEAKVVATNTGAGVATGVGVAALAPSAAMAVATTFGAASTGTAISALSGAAATNAALAWLGGGALVAGGGGMAGGNALLALAGPVGWGIGLVSLAGGTYLMRQKNEKIAKEANGFKIEVGKEIAVLKASLVDIKGMDSEIAFHSQGVFKQLNKLENSNSLTAVIRKFKKRSFNDFSKDEINQLIALKVNVEALSKLLVKNVQR